MPTWLDEQEVDFDLMRHVIDKRPGCSRFDDSLARYKRGRTTPVPEELLTKARRSTRFGQEQVLQDLENRTVAFLEAIRKKRAALAALEASGDCLHSDLLTAVQEEDPGPKSGWKLLEDEEERTFSG